MLNLDTHILIHALAGTLKAQEKQILSEDAWSISAIVLWELSKLIQCGRLELDFDDRDVQQALRAIPVWPLTLEIARQAIDLDFQGDPADEIIAATSLVHAVPLVTRDRVIRRSKIVPLAKIS